MIETVKIVKIYPTSVWIESDPFGGKHVMRQHEGMEPFCYCSFFYDYAHTSNSQIHSEAIAMALSLGATEPIEERHRGLEFPTLEEMKAQVAALQESIALDEPAQQAAPAAPAAQRLSDADVSEIYRSLRITFSVPDDCDRYPTTWMNTDSLEKLRRAIETAFAAKNGITLEQKHGAD